MYTIAIQSICASSDQCGAHAQPACLRSPFATRATQWKRQLTLGPSDRYPRWRFASAAFALPPSSGGLEARHPFIQPTKQSGRSHTRTRRHQYKWGLRMQNEDGMVWEDICRDLSRLSGHVSISRASLVHTRFCLRLLRPGCGSLDADGVFLLFLAHPVVREL